MYVENQNVKHVDYGSGVIRKVSGNEVVIDFGKFEITFTIEQLAGKIG